MRFKATRKWPIKKFDEVLLYWMEMLTGSHQGQAKQNNNSNNKITHLLPTQQMPATAQTLTSTTPITSRNSCIYFKPNNPRRATVSLDCSFPTKLISSYLDQIMVPSVNAYHTPLSQGGHSESPENKKLCFCTASLALNSRLAESCRAKTKLFIPPRLNVAAE